MTVDLIKPAVVLASGNLHFADIIVPRYVCLLTRKIKLINLMLF